MSGTDGTVTLDRQSSAASVTVRLPIGTEVTNQSFARSDRNGALSLPARNPLNGSHTFQATLGRTPEPFDVVPDPMNDFASQSPFFFQDLKRSFFVEPSDAYRRWVRERPTWTIRERIPLEVVQLYPGTLDRPLPSGPNPWQFDRATVVTNPSIVDLRTTPAVLNVSGSRVTGLAAVGAAGLADTFGARAAFVGAEELAPRSNLLTIEASARILGSAGNDLLTLTSPRARASAGDLRTLRTDTFYRIPELTRTAALQAWLLKQWDGKRYRFDVFYHPYVRNAVRQINRFGVDGLWDPSASGPEPLLRRQQLATDFFQQTYSPTSVLQPYPRDDFDFSYGGAYSSYNWELFFHVPFAIACHLSKNQRFEEAQRWFHYIFDPTESSNLPTPQRFWKIRPFYELFYGEDAEAGPIHELLLLLQYNGSDGDKLRARDLLQTQIAEWRKNPFNPHAIARLRVVAYQKAVVMRYVTNLIEWGDQLFRRDTLESINEATQLYLLAAQILGRRPREVKVEPPAPRTFNQLRALGLDEFSNAMVEEVEGYLPEPRLVNEDAARDNVPVIGATLFFCVPPNDRLITEFWDKVADRLFKIRHCMNIEGIVRQLPLFEPPIDPAMLVRAAAAGIDLASALSDLNAPLPYFRYQILSQLAVELCTDVRALGQALLSALEKRDAESMMLIRADHESKLLESLKHLKQRQIDEAKRMLEGLVRGKQNADLRKAFYTSRPYMNAREITHLTKQQAARDAQQKAEIAGIVANYLSTLPNLSVGIAGFGGSPTVSVSFGGSNLAAASQAIAGHFNMSASAAAHESAKALILGGYDQRSDERGLQADVAGADSASFEQQILAAEIRVAIAEKDLENLELQVAQATEIEEFLRSKYTNKELYSWMVGQLSSLYFQSYKLAYDLAKRAERAWQFELAVSDRSFIQFGYWDGLKKGLLAGERLNYDLQRMTSAYLETNRRDYELTRHISLRALDAAALLMLQTQGSCVMTIPETWFDVDSPGHYMRRIKTVALSIPSVTGPYVPVRVTLTLLSSRVRMSSDPNAPAYRDDPVGIQSIVTSRAQEDAGLFETNLHDPRYLPFEGAGAVSQWRLELPATFRQFDYSTISDVIMHMRYTARDGGRPLGDAITTQLTAALNALVMASQSGRASGTREGLLRLLSARHDFPNAWQRFMYPPDAETDQQLDVDVEPRHLAIGLQPARGSRRWTS